MTYAPYADLVWLETKSPNIEQARYFARKIREKYPGKYVSFQFYHKEVVYPIVTRWFVYNLSPSFNWSQHGFSGEIDFLQCRTLS